MKTKQLPLALRPEDKADGAQKQYQPKTISIVRLQMVREGTIKYAGSEISSPEKLARLVHEYLDSPDREYFVAVCLDSKNKPTHIQTVHIGSLSFCAVYPREIWKLAIISNAAAVVVAHNHPSGSPYPSQEDLATTKRLVEAGEIMGIPVLDHVVIGNAPEVFYSFRENSLI